MFLFSTANQQFFPYWYMKFSLLVEMVHFLFSNELHWQKNARLLSSFPPHPFCRPCLSRLPSLIFSMIHYYCCYRFHLWNSSLWTIHMKIQGKIKKTMPNRWAKVFCLCLPWLLFFLPLSLIDRLHWLNMKHMKKMITKKYALLDRPFISPHHPFPLRGLAVIS